MSEQKSNLNADETRIGCRIRVINPIEIEKHVNDKDENSNGIIKKGKITVIPLKFPYVPKKGDCENTPDQLDMEIAAAAKAEMMQVEQNMETADKKKKRFEMARDVLGYATAICAIFSGSFYWGAVTYENTVQEDKAALALVNDGIVAVSQALPDHKGAQEVVKVAQEYCAAQKEKIQFQTEKLQMLDEQVKASYILGALGALFALGTVCAGCFYHRHKVNYKKNEELYFAKQNEWYQKGAFERVIAIHSR